MTPAAMAALMGRAYAGRGWSEAEFADLVARPGTLVTGDETAFVIGQVIAGEGEVFMVATDPAHQRQGLARAALSAFHDGARAAGAGRVILDVAADNLPARALYESLGYSVIAERRAYYPRGSEPSVSALVLEKPL